MKIASGDWAGIITAIAGFVTVISGIVTQILMTIRQTKQLKDHSDENAQKIVSGTSGTFKRLDQ
jgi:hypothetical protein